MMKRTVGEKIFGLVGKLSLWTLILIGLTLGGSLLIVAVLGGVFYFTGVPAWP
jgi:hypothetical protein